MTRGVLAAYAVAALVTAFFPVFWGELPVPTDCALRLLPGYAMPQSPPRIGNDELWDVPTAFLPWTRAVSEAYRDRRLPLRFAANGCGTPCERHRADTLRHQVPDGPICQPIAAGVDEQGVGARLFLLS